MVPSSFGCGSTVLAARATLAPWDAAFSAIARPMPREPPVMNRVFPFSDIACWSLFSERRLGTVDAVAAFDNCALESACLNSNVFCKKARKRAACGSIARTQRGEGILREHAASGRVAEQAQIRCRPGKRRVG